jgi:hypothetical protein
MMVDRPLAPDIAAVRALIDDGIAARRGPRRRRPPVKELP